MNARQKLENAKFFIPLLNSYLHENDNLLYRLRGADENSFTKSPSLQRLIDRVEEDIKREVTEFYETLSLINELKDQKHRTIMKLRYIEHKTAVEIAELLGHRNDRYVYRLFKEAYKEIEEIFKNRVQSEQRSIEKRNTGHSYEA